MNKITQHSIDDLREFLTNSAIDVFSTMFNINARPCAVRYGRESVVTCVVGSVGFIGDANGVVYIHVTEIFARTLAGRMLGISEGELQDHEMVNDVVGELTNMIVGVVKSRLCDSGVPCVLTIPSIVRGQNICAEATLSSECRLLSIMCDAEPLLIELIMKSPQ